MSTNAKANVVKHEVRRGYALYKARCAREGVAAMSMNEWARICVEAIQRLEDEWPFSALSDEVH